MKYRDFKVLCETHGWALTSTLNVAHGNATRYLYTDSMGRHVAELFHDNTSLGASYVRLNMNTEDIRKGMKP